MYTLTENQAIRVHMTCLAAQCIAPIEVLAACRCPEELCGNVRPRLMAKSQPSPHWRGIRDAASAVTLATQRSSGLWALPSSQFDLSLLYAPTGSLEHRMRQGESFGSPSISVTFVALEALEAVGAWDEDAVVRALAALVHFTHRDGSFGSQIARAGAPPTVNSSARHTACALLLLLRHSDLAAEDPRAQAAAGWLASPASQLSSGGWAYEDRDRELGLGAMTTAAALAALCEYADRRKSAPPKLRSVMRESISRGHAALGAIARDGLWDCSAEGGTAGTQVGDTALILWFMGQAQRHGLAKFTVTAAEQLGDNLRRFLSLGLVDGWPTQPGSHEQGLSSTILGLWAVLEAPPVLELRPFERAFVTKAVEMVAARLCNDALLVNELRTYDWAVLTKVGSLLVGPLGAQESTRLRRSNAALAARAGAARLSSRDIATLPALARRPIQFALTNGGHNSMMASRLDGWFQSRPAFQQGAIMALVGSLLSLAVTWPQLGSWGHIVMRLARSFLDARP